MLLNTYPKLIEKILCRCGVIQDLQNFLNNPTRDRPAADNVDPSQLLSHHSSCFVGPFPALHTFAVT